MSDSYDVSLDIYVDFHLKISTCIAIYSITTSPEIKWCPQKKHIAYLCPTEGWYIQYVILPYIV